MATDYVPRTDAERSVWSTNLRTQLPAYLAALGLSPEDEAAVQQNCTTISSSIAANVQAQAAAEQSTQTKKTACTNALGIIRPIIARAKTAAGYTEAIGHALRIVGTGTDPDWDTYQPRLAAKVFPGHVMLDFVKGAADGVNIYTRLKGTSPWTKLALDTHSPYQDNRPSSQPGSPENREYMGIGVLHDEEVGQMSDIVSVTFAG